MKTDRDGREGEEGKEEGKSEKERRKEQRPRRGSEAHGERAERQEAGARREVRRSGRDRSRYLAAVWQRHQLADATYRNVASFGPAQPAHPAGRFLR